MAIEQQEFTLNQPLPPPPEPSAAQSNGLADGIDPAFRGLSDEPLLRLTDACWDITLISPRGALQMLIHAIERLAEATGDVPPTPPVSRPATRRNSRHNFDHWPTPLRNELGSMLSIGSPEAHPSEPITVEVGAGAQDIVHQRIAIARRFFSKSVPRFSLSEYLTRLHQYCPHSPGVYLAAAGYCYRLCVADATVPATRRTVHRLTLASIRVAAKALEDNKWTQDRMSLIGGISCLQLMNLELTLCYLLDFELGVRPAQLASSMYMLQQATHDNLCGQQRIPDAFKLRPPSFMTDIGAGS